MAEDWFAFERAIATLLEHHLGFTIVDRGVCGRGDQGIDILATKVVGGRSELWVVQCKHYSDNPVGPRIIRELLGSMTTVRHDEDQTVRAMLVTTGRITGDALKLAATQGVQTYDGTQPGLKWSSRVMLDPVDLRFLRQQVFKMPTPPRRVLALAIAA